MIPEQYMDGDTAPGESISGSRDTLTEGCSVHVAIRVLSQDGQSISGSLTGGFSVHVAIRVLSRDGQSILGSQDTLTRKFM